MKLENILVNNGRIKLSDFGLSVILNEEEGEILIGLVGTPVYMSP